VEPQGSHTLTLNRYTDWTQGMRKVRLHASNTAVEASDPVYQDSTFGFLYIATFRAEIESD